MASLVNQNDSLLSRIPATARQSLDSGLRELYAYKNIDAHGISQGTIFFAHADIDLQAFLKNGSAVLGDAAKETIDDINVDMGFPLFQHTDVLTGLSGKILGASPNDLLRPTFVIDSLGNVHLYRSAWQAFYRHATPEEFNRIANLVTDFEFPR